MVHTIRGVLAVRTAAPLLERHVRPQTTPVEQRPPRFQWSTRKLRGIGLSFRQINRNVRACSGSGGNTTNPKAPAKKREDSRLAAPSCIGQAAAFGRDFICARLRVKSDNSCGFACQLGRLLQVIEVRGLTFWRRAPIHKRGYSNWRSPSGGGLGAEISPSSGFKTRQSFDNFFAKYF